MKEQVLEIQIGRMGLQKKINAVQADSGRVLRCTVTDMQIPTGATARIYAIKPSGAKIYNTCTVSGIYVFAEFTTQMLAEIGIVYCQIEITKSNKVVTSFEFSIDVVRTLVDSAAIESTNEFTTLQVALRKAEDLAADVGNAQIQFTQSVERLNVLPGEKLKNSLGKVSKWFADMKDAAFYGVADNLTTTAGNLLLHAKQGKKLKDDMDKINTDLSNSIASLNARLAITETDISGDKKIMGYAYGNIRVLVFDNYAIQSASQGGGGSVGLIYAPVKSIFFDVSIEITGKGTVALRSDGTITLYSGDMSSLLTGNVFGTVTYLVR